MGAASIHHTHTQLPAPRFRNPSKGSLKLLGNSSKGAFSL